MDHHSYHAAFYKMKFNDDLNTIEDGFIKYYKKFSDPSSAPNKMFEDKHNQVLAEHYRDEHTIRIVRLGTDIQYKIAGKAKIEWRIVKIPISKVNDLMEQMDEE
jgi:hypothetical protein